MENEKKLERVTDVTQLAPGDVIIHVGPTAERLEFLCVHPHDAHYSLFLDRNLDGTDKFYNHRLENEEWFRYTDGMDRLILEKQIEWYKDRIKDIERFMSKKWGYPKTIWHDEE